MKLRLKIALWLEKLRRSNLKKMHPLQQLFWESTLRCNVHCLHCGSDCIASVETPDMPAEDFLHVIQDFQLKSRTNLYFFSNLFAYSKYLLYLCTRNVLPMEREEWLPPRKVYLLV